MTVRTQLLTITHGETLTDRRPRCLVSRHEPGGSEHFKAKVLAGIPQHPDIPEWRQAQRRPSLKTVTAVVARYYGFPKTRVFTSTRGKGVKTPARS